jgi:glucose/mannose-6-phosphate isomerase
MGGSAIGGDIVNNVFSDKIKVPLVVNRAYEVPGFLSDKTLFIAVSYSGNTEETLSAMDKAVKKGCSVIAVSSGGKLDKLSKSSNIPIINIPLGFPPRAALGYILPALIFTLSSAGLIESVEEDLLNAVKLLKRLREKYSIKDPLKSNEVKQMAKKILGKVPMIISCIDNTYAAGLRLKTQLNENSKMTALHVTFPELDHNDLVNISYLRNGKHNYVAIILRDRFDSERMRKRIEITKSLASGNIGGFNEIWAQGKSKLERILSLIMYGDFLSVYLAVLQGTDPTPVSVIEQLKKELSR